MGDEDVEPWEKRMRSGFGPSVAESPLVQIWQTEKDPYFDVARELARVREEHAATADEEEPPHGLWARVKRRA